MKKKDFLLIIVVLLAVGLVKLCRRSEVVIRGGTDVAEPYYNHMDAPHQFPSPPEEFSGVRQVQLVNPAGSLSVLPAESEAVVVQLTRIAFHPSEKKAGDINDRIRIETLNEGGVLKLVVADPPTDLRGGYQVNYTIWLPEGVALDANTAHGRVEIAHVTAKLKISHRSGDLSVSSLTGDLDLTADEAKVQLAQLVGVQHVKAVRSDIEVREAQRLELLVKRCQVDVLGVSEKVLVNQSVLNHLKIEKAPEVEITGSGNRISISDVTERVQIIDEFEDIDLQNVSGEIRVESKRSNMTLRNIWGKSLAIKNSFRDTRISKARIGTGRIDLHQSELTLSLDGLEGKFSIEGNHSDVLLSLPDDPEYSVDLFTKMGNIVFPANPSFIETKSRGGHSLVRKAGPKRVELVTSYGDIVLNVEGRK